MMGDKQSWILTNGKILLRYSLALLVAAASITSAANVDDDLTDLSLDDLMDIQVTSVSKKSESLTGAAAAIFVLTGDEIRRSGATNIPEALRLVPGLHVARVDAHTWAIAARGFNGTVSDKLEVLMDGRSLYTPLFSGVFWDAQDTFMEDIDRIEVIRGPGATLWGANAVNGVINIVTKSAADTQGFVGQVSAGDELEWQTAMRYGSRVGDDAHLRVYAKSFDRDDSERADGMDASDSHDMTQAGFRLDWARDERDHYTLQGDIYEAALDNPSTPPNNVAGDPDEAEGYNLIGRWTRKLSDDSDFSLQLFVDHTDRLAPGVFGETRDTYDLDFKHRFQLSDRHEITWGGGYRRSEDDQVNPPAALFSTQLLFLPDERTVETYNLFVQDQISLTDRLAITVGTKVEENDFTGTEIQPSMRFAWQRTPQNTIWGAVSRAVRVPNRLDDDILFQVAGAPPPPLLTGNRDFDSEEVIAWELGYRLKPREDLLIDVAVFYNDYDDLRGVEPGAPGTLGTLENNYEGTSYGGEIALLWRYRDNLRFWAGYSYLQLDLEPKSGSLDVGTEASEDNSPTNQALLRAEWNVLPNVEVGGTLRYVGEVPNQVSGTPTSTLDSYTELDLKLAWFPSREWELALTGQNLLDESHPELGTDRTGATAASASAVSEVERSVHATVTWRPAH